MKKKINGDKKVQSKKLKTSVKKKKQFQFSTEAENFLAKFQAYSGKTREQVLEAFILQKELESRIFTVAGVFQKLKLIFIKLGVK